MKRLFLVSFAIIMLYLSAHIFSNTKGGSPANLTSTSIQTTKPVEPITGLNLESFRSRLQAGKYETGSSQSSLAASRQASLVVITNALVIDGTGAEPIEHGVVVIADKHIVTVGRFDEIDVPAQARIIDVNGQTVMPGLINAHVHQAFNPALRYRFLVEGVTSVCDLGSPLERLSDFEREITTQGRPRPPTSVGTAMSWAH